MNCEEFQRGLLGAENPATPADELEAHLATCEPCREYQGRLVNIEQNVSRLPVPEATTKDQFVQAFLEPDSARDSFVAVLPLPKIVHIETEWQRPAYRDPPYVVRRPAGNGRWLVRRIKASVSRSRN